MGELYLTMSYLRRTNMVCHKSKYSEVTKHTEINEKNCIKSEEKRIELKNSPNQEKNRNERN